MSLQLICEMKKLGECFNPEAQTIVDAMDISNAQEQAFKQSGSKDSTIANEDNHFEETGNALINQMDANFTFFALDKYSKPSAFKEVLHHDKNFH
jgi:hypothetical protein